MSTYAIGDLQGCFEPFERLLCRINFRPKHDRIWLVGDLVNRGPASLEVLRWVRKHENNLVTVLGNHDLHLLATAAGLRKPSPKDTLLPVLQADDRDDLLDWLQRRPLFYREGSTCLVHAGLHPQWSLEDAASHAREVEQGLREDGGRLLLEALRAGAADEWSENLTGATRLATLVAIFTRIRTCTATGQLLETYKGPPQSAPKGFRPWFEIPHRRAPETTVVFGHWAALGLYKAPGLLAVDTGCVWGGALTAVRLEDGRVFQEPAAPPD
ncbi:MAG: symmetrical bis(5'-nucleosyl)-tetraphosphatase [Planctomycetota bacterium]|jgi:bis(5'-nucleosyl)-tetraphosphatase (symmetrical)|nr:symmetrical bis(5'-nucleosyl)-tetraphosphatase [Planctomycetota bacterium]